MAASSRDAVASDRHPARCLREVPGRSESSGWRRTTRSILRSTRGTPPASRCCATRRRTRPDRSLNFVSSIRRTRRGTSGTAASRRANFSAPRSTPIGSKGRTNPSTGSASIRRRSCSIRTRRRCSSRQRSAATRAPDPGPTDGRAPLGRLPSKADRGPSDRGGPAIHLPGRHRLRTARQRIHRARELRGHAREARHVCRRDREDSLPQGPRRHGRRAAPGPPVRSAGGQLLGLHDAALLLAPPVVRARRGLRRIPRRWCRRSTRRASRCGSTWSTTTPPKATRPGRPTVTAASTTAATTCSRRTGDTTSTTPAAATRCAPAIPARASSCSKASASGRARWAWMAFASISPRSFHAPPTAR